MFKKKEIIIILSFNLIRGNELIVMGDFSSLFVIIDECLRNL